MIGSDTRIIVVLRCTENRTPRFFASAICSARKASSAARRMTAASMISPLETLVCSLSTVTLPSRSTCSIRTVPSRSIVCERSVARKSSSLIVDTCERESRVTTRPLSGDGGGRAALTEAGARRSEFPWRSTGLTALPLTLS